ncbi:MAG: hypothetical protein LQ337_003283 [Flavoplaca oasis]|nr:MAG: hypothetical protein LQ337_003283 [Flavoplaca oasis]
MHLLPTTLFLLIHLTSHLTISQSIGDRINQFDPQWHCNVDSWESKREDCDKAIDSNDNTFWHSQYNPTDDPLPHRITIDMGRLYAVRSLTVLPRQDGNGNGNIGNWRISLSPDAEETARTVSGTWEDDSSRKTVDFGNATLARYVRLEAFTEAGDRGPWTSVAQIDVYEDNGTAEPNPPSTPNASPGGNGSGNRNPSNRGSSNKDSSAADSNARVVIVDGQTTTLGASPTGGMMGGYRNSSRSTTIGMNTSTTATATSTSSLSVETATSEQTTATAAPGEGVGGAPPASEAMSGRVSGLGVTMVGLTAAVVVASMFFQL